MGCVVKHTGLARLLGNQDIAGDQRDRQAYQIGHRGPQVPTNVARNGEIDDNVIPTVASRPSTHRNVVSHQNVVSLCLLVTGLMTGDSLLRAESSAERLTFFESKIRPVLVKHCYQCHSRESDEIGGKLQVDSREGMLIGGESGPVLVAGQPEQSLLIQALRHAGPEMPPEEPLPARIVNDFVHWITNGAEDPRSQPHIMRETTTTDPESLWSFHPRRVAPLPPVQNAAWVRDPIDQFVLAKIEAAELQPTQNADPWTLVRRLHYDLIGLPPTHGEVEAFVGDYTRDPELAVRQWVDRLLASPQFGVRWGRHWLDVARYGESNGDDGLGRNATFPHAWRYRDYVIDAFNRDVPYDQFLKQQIAGDLLPAETVEEHNRHLVATGFLAMGSKPAAAMNKDFPMDIVDDQINVVATAVMGLSVACARCHDHKQDPIPTRDYYALAGIFSSTQTLYGAAGNEKLTAPPTPLHELQPPADAHRDATARDTLPALAMGVRERGKPVDCKIHINGEGAKLGPVVPRGTLTAYEQLGANEPGLRSELDIPSQSSGRAELAAWLTHSDHPHTARVIVNRVWLHLFGQGIVATPDDFGVDGAKPSHPELLDYMAERFVASGWSLKRLIRTIVLSRTYQLDSRCDPQWEQEDPENQWLARHSRRRLDAEAIRDSMLQASGDLDLSFDSGSAIEAIDGLINWPPGEASNLHRASHQRSVYLCLLRHAAPSELVAFDFPDGVAVMGQRETTTLPAQTLFLLNNDFVIRQASRLASQLLDTPNSDQRQRIETLYSAVLHRFPSDAEVLRSIDYLTSIDQALSNDFPQYEARRYQVWTSLCQALMATNEFRYVD